MSDAKRLTHQEAKDALAAEGTKLSIKDMIRVQTAPILGEMVAIDALDPELQVHPGLIALTKGDTKVCPVFQFEADAEGRRNLNPNLAREWLLLKLLQIDQVQENEWATAGRLRSESRLLDGRTAAEVLMDPSTPQDLVNQLYADTVSDAISFGKTHGITVVDPRTRLPEAGSQEAKLARELLAPAPQLPPAQ